MEHTIDQQELRTLTNKAAIMPLTPVEQRRLQNLIDTAEGHANADPETKYNRAFRRFLSVGPGLSQFSFENPDRTKKILSPSDRAILRAREISSSNYYIDSESRDMADSSGPDAPTSVATMGGAYPGSSTSGFFASVEFNAQVTSAMRTYGGVLSEATILSDETGRIRAFPTDDDTSVSGELVKEGQQVTQHDVSINQVLVGAFKFSSRMVRISRELCEDSAIDLQAYLAERMGIRLARTMNDRFTNGKGSGQGEPFGLIYNAPLGCVAQGSSGNTGGSESANNSIGSTDLENLVNSVDSAYHPGARFMMHSRTLAGLKSSVDKNGRPLWVAGLSTGGSDSLMGSFGITINDSMQALSPTTSSPQVSTISVAFGQFSKYVIKKVSPMVVYTLLEKYALEGVVGYLCLVRADGGMLDRNAVKVLVNPLIT